MAASTTRKNFDKIEGGVSPRKWTRVRNIGCGKVPSLYKNAVETQKKHMAIKKPPTTWSHVKGPPQETQGQTKGPHHKTVQVREIYSLFLQPNKTR